MSVWTEIDFTSDGLSVTLYSEDENGRPIVEDELWFTYDEIDAEGVDSKYTLEASSK